MFPHLKRIEKKRVLKLAYNINNDKKSVAFNLVFNGIDHTLTDTEVMEVFNKIIKEVEKKHHAILRNN